MNRFFSALLLLSLVSCQKEVPVDEVCNDGIDNDLDFSADCNDDDCTQDPFCFPDEDCSDNEDNDQNGLTDCQDDACAGTSDCFCVNTLIVFNSSLPLSFEGDSADGINAFNVVGCQTGDARESVFNIDFVADAVDVLIEPLDGVPMVLQTTNSCDEGGLSTCARNSDSVGAAPLLVENVDVSGGARSLFVGAREAGQTGKFRITFSLPQ